MLCKGYVYLLGDSEKDKIYKIGVTRGSLYNRLKKLQTGNSGELFLIKSYKTDYCFLLKRNCI